MQPTASLQGACDAHIHVFDANAPALAPVPAHASATDYQAVQKRLGTTRAVIVQPRLYGTDNSVTLAAIAALGPGNARGIAVLHPDVTDATLAALHAGGIRGLRFSLHTAVQAAAGLEMVEPLAHRVHELGWHLQLHWTADQITTHEALLRRLPTPLVFDHLARVPPQAGPSHPAFRIVQDLLTQGRAWVKLSGPYLCSQQGLASGYADTVALARAWVACAPDRLVWGSDWPHVTEHDKPDALQLLALLSQWAESASLRRQILVDNPVALYGFAPA